MVKDPSGSPDWNAGAFNATLQPMVTVCALPGTITTASAITPSTPCGAIVLPPTAAAANLAGEFYQLNWQVPNSSTTFYRVSVTVGSKTLGFADLETASNMSQLKNVNTNEFVALNDGRTLPIKFRIERYALCAVPGVGPCGTSTIDLTTGGTVTTTLVTGGEVSGVSIPPQPAGAAATTITVQPCDNINPRATDLPTFGPCLSVKADPALSDGALTNAATVFICDVSDLTITTGDGGQVADHDQADRITLHRVDPDPAITHVGGYIVAALPHAPACAPSVSMREPTVSGMLAALRHGEWRRAARQAAGLLAPKSAYAARYIDLGGGGFTDSFSDFQFALPSSMEVVATTDGQIASFGTMLPLFPTVRVSDVGGAPVRGATVRFATNDGSTTQSQVVTDENGLARVGWTLGNSETNALTAYGHGLAGNDLNGPRPDRVDPFQPIQSHFDGAGAGAGTPVAVSTGSVVFSAIGTFATSFEPSNASWLNDATRGFWHSSTLAGVTNSLYPVLVHLAPGDNSNGALPAPFAGAHALWFGTEGGSPTGNYVGALASTTESGGTSTAPRSGIAVSPIFRVPNTPNAVQLSFQSWFEIESVNPHLYDAMEVRIHDVEANTDDVFRLNPTSDPGGNSTTPFTSGGFNQPPVWVNVTRDLSSHRGHHLQVTLSFDTVDNLYNGFRGWVVDDVALRVLSTPVVTTLIPMRGASLDVVGTDQAPPPRSWQP